MIQIRDLSNIINLYKSSFDFENSTAFNIKLVNDLSKIEYTINYTINTDSSVYNSFDLNVNGSNGLVLKDYGFYTLKIFDNSILKYMERVQYIKTDYKEYVDKTEIIYYDNDNTYLIYDEQ